MPLCMECGADFPKTRGDRLFCSKEHKQAYNNRQIKRGNKILPLVYRWRALRSVDPDASNAAFSRMTALLSNWIDDDRRANRAVPAMPYLGVEGAVTFKPPTSKSAMDKADREMNRDFALMRRNLKL